MYECARMCVRSERMHVTMGVSTCDSSLLLPWLDRSVVEEDQQAFTLISSNTDLLPSQT